MRTIILKYAGDCRKCGATLPAGNEAVYEKRVGVFCPACAPTDPEEIRAYRQEGADAKADRYEGWAAKRRDRANATFKSNARFTEDIAFNTQPGHIPLRARIIKQNDKAFESIETAQRFEEKAKSLRHVRVAGDAERRRQAVRDIIKPRLKVGMRIGTPMYGNGIIERINRKTVRVGKCGVSGTYSVNVDISWVTILEGGNNDKAHAGTG